MKPISKFVSLFLAFTLFLQLLPAYALDDIFKTQENEDVSTEGLYENDSYSAFFERICHEN